MKALTATLILLLANLMSTTASAQGLESAISIKRPDLSGKWRDRSPAKTMGDFLPPVFGIILTIEQRLPAVRFRLTARVESMPDVAESGEFTLFTDGRGDRFEPGIMKYPSTTAWSDNKLVSTFRNQAGAATGRLQLELLSPRTLRMSWFDAAGPDPGKPVEISTFDRID